MAQMRALDGFGSRLQLASLVGRLGVLGGGAKRMVALEKL